MEVGPPWELDIDALAMQPVSRAWLLLDIHYGASTNVVLDADSGRFIRLPAPEPPWVAHPLALAPDGSAVFLRANTKEPWARGLYWYTLATGEQRQYALPNGWWVAQAAVSPDGWTMATASDGGQDDDQVLIHLIDLETKVVRLLWSGEGGSCSLAWSPNGRFLAVAYEVDDIASMATTVVDATDGTVVRHYPGLETLASTNGAWLGEHELIVFPFDYDEAVPPVLVTDVDSGRIRRYEAPPPGWAGGCHAVIDGRLIRAVHGKGIYSTELDGSDPQVFLAAHPDLSISVFEVALNTTPPVTSSV